MAPADDSLWERVEPYVGEPLGRRVDIDRVIEQLLEEAGADVAAAEQRRGALLNLHRCKHGDVLKNDEISAAVALNE